jgi:hypothetical protein
LGFINFVKIKYKQTNVLINQVSILFILLGIGMIFLNSINKKNVVNIPRSDNSFKCTISDTNENSLSTDELKTSLSISLIGFDTEVFKTDLVKNSIPALYKPKFVEFTNVQECLPDDEIALVVQNDDTVLVFPQKILRYHIAINTYINDIPILVTYSPLAEHYEVFSRNLKSTILDFGISGLLYKNTDLLYDISSDSLWSQFNGKALVGNYSGATLEKLPYNILRIEEIRELYSNFKVLSFDTGYMRNYNINTFDKYLSDDTIVGTILNEQVDFNNKDIVLGFNINNKQYSILESSITETIGFYVDESINLEISKNKGSYLIYHITPQGKLQIKDLTTTYAFIWYDFFPLTKKIVIK